jgi:hypothetical protein
VIRRLALVGLLLVGAMQLVPYGWRHSNPPAVRSATFPSPQAAALFESACADCHSNGTDWPAYSYVAPMSWLVRRDVDEGREKFNVDDWDRSARKADEAADEVEDGDMPPWQYTLIHRGAKLSEAEKQLLSDALDQMDESTSGKGTSNSGKGNSNSSGKG